MNLESLNVGKMLGDSMKQQGMKLAIDALYAEKSEEEFRVEVLEPMGIVLEENTRYSLDTMKNLVIKKNIEEGTCVNFLAKGLGWDKDAFMMSTFLGEPKMESMKSIRSLAKADNRIGELGNVFFSACRITNLASFLSAPGDSWGALKEIQEKLSFPTDGALVLPSPNSENLALQRLHTSLADLAGKALGGKKYPQVFKFVDLNDGVLPAPKDDMPLQFVVMPGSVPYENELPSEEFLENLQKFREKKKGAFLETGEFLAYGDIFANKKGEANDPASVFKRYNISKPNGQMLQTAFDIANTFHPIEDGQDEAPAIT